ncbi:MAG: hypothetical protein DGJ47_000988 [Rickettsiaceae bacterium]
MINGWINLYKPRGISSAKAVSIVKRSFPKRKIGHTGTLDLEAEGVLPIAIGESTKLVSILIDAKKQYKFTVKFGAKTDTADSAGKITENCDYIPSKTQCFEVVKEFIGEIKQIPPSYSALKVNGQRAYKMAREKGEFLTLPSRYINIYDLKCVDYDELEGTASFICTCSKGTYIRTLAEDISLNLQSLGYVIELQRLKVGMFDYGNSLNVENILKLAPDDQKMMLAEKCLKIESVLDDIPVLDANEEQVQKIKFGQAVSFDYEHDLNIVRVRSPSSALIAIGNLHSKDFKSSRVFNL